MQINFLSGEVILVGALLPPVAAHIMAIYALPCVCARARARATKDAFSLKGQDQSLQRLLSCTLHVYMHKTQLASSGVTALSNVTLSLDPSLDLSSI